MKSLQTKVWHKIFGYQEGDKIVFKHNATVFNLLGMETGMIIKGMAGTIEKVCSDNSYVITLDKRVGTVKKVVVNEGDFE